MECLHPHVLKGLLCPRKGVSVCPVCNLVLTPSELLVPPPPSLIASLVLIEELSHASELAVWSELPPSCEISRCPSPSWLSSSLGPWNCPPRSSHFLRLPPAFLWAGKRISLPAVSWIRLRRKFRVKFGGWGKSPEPPFFSKGFLAGEVFS